MIQLLKTKFITDGITKYLQELDETYLPLVYDSQNENQYLKNARQFSISKAMEYSSSYGFTKTLEDRLREEQAVLKLLNQYDFGNYIDDYKQTIKVMKLIKRAIKYYNLYK